MALTCDEVGKQNEALETLHLAILHKRCDRAVVSAPAPGGRTSGAPEQVGWGRALVQVTHPGEDH